MAIPKYDEIMPAAIEYLSENGLSRYRDLETPLAQRFGLSEQEITTEYESGNGTIFLDRISWALSYMSLSGLVARPKRGFYELTELGRSYLGKPEEIKQFVKQKIAERQVSKKADASKEEVAISDNNLLSGVTPHEALDQAYNNIRSTTYETILETILSKSPYEFERLVVKLLDKMGYGGQVKDAARVTKPVHSKILW